MLLQVLDGRSLIPVGVDVVVRLRQVATIKATRPASKDSHPVFPLVVFAFKGGWLVFRRERADTLITARPRRLTLAFALVLVLLVHLRHRLLGRLSLSLCFRCSGFRCDEPLVQLLQLLRNLLHRSPSGLGERLPILGSTCGTSRPSPPASPRCAFRAGCAASQAALAGKQASLP